MLTHETNTEATVTTNARDEVTARSSYDEAGNLVAAGSGGNKLGHLGKGDRDEFRIAFPYVYRNLPNAKTIQITLETNEPNWKDKGK